MTYKALIKINTTERFARSLLDYTRFCGSTFITSTQLSNVKLSILYSSKVQYLCVRNAVALQDVGHQ